jgi:hypothetical protein
MMGNTMLTIALACFIIGGFIWLKVRKRGKK